MKKRYKMDKYAPLDDPYILIPLIFEAFKIKFISYEFQSPKICGNEEEEYPTKEFMKKYDPQRGDYHCRICGYENYRKTWIIEKEEFQDHIKSGYIKEIT